MQEKCDDAAAIAAKSWRVRKLRILRLVVAYIRQAGGWNKAFPPEGGVYECDFNLDTKDDAWIEQHLRFRRHEIPIVIKAMRIPKWVCTSNRDACHRDLAFIMLLFKMSWPRRLIDFALEFGGNGARSMRICNALTVLLYHKYHKKMEELDRERLTDEYILEMCRIQFEKFGTCPHVWGFIDATVRPCCRPVYFQEAIYNGKDRVHAIKFQTIVSVDGMICHCSGPWSGRRHDSYLYNKTLPRVLADLPIIIADDGETPLPVAVYADPGYVLSTRVLMPFPDGRTDAVHCAFNRTMSRARITVEWGYGRVTQLFKHLVFKDNLKVFKSPIGAQYFVGVLLTNAKTCVDGGNNVSDYFGCCPPNVCDFFKTLAD